MSVQPTESEYDDDSDDEVDLPEPARKRLRHLEKENKRLSSLESENAQYKQREAIRAAGLDLNEVQMKALSATHEGESTPEAYRKSAEALGFAEPEPEVDPNDVAAHQQLANARQDAQRVGDTSYEDELATAKNAQEVEQIARKHNRAWG